MAGGTISRTPHFALHRLVLSPLEKAAESTGSDASKPSMAAQQAPDGSVSPAPVAEAREPQALFVVPAGDAQPWMGAMVPKRWARRAVTRNTIKRQIYATAAAFEPQLAQAAHVVRLRAGFDRKQFISATSDALKLAVREELQQLFTYAVRKQKSHAGKSAGPAAPAGSASTAVVADSTAPLAEER